MAEDEKSKRLREKAEQDAARRKKNETKDEQSFLSKQFNALADKISETGEKTTQVVGEFAKPVSDLGDKFGDLTKTGMEMALASNPLITALVGGTTFLGKGVLGLTKSSEDNSDNEQENEDKNTSILASATEKVSSLVSAGNDLSKRILGIFQSQDEAEMTREIEEKDRHLEHMKALDELAVNIVEGIYVAKKKEDESSSSFISAFIGSITGLLTTAFGKILGGLKGLKLPALGNSLGNILKLVKGFTMKALTVFGKVFAIFGFLTGFIGDSERIFGEEVSLAQRVISGFVGLIRAIPQLFFDIFDWVVNWLSGGELQTNVGDGVMKLFDGVINFFNDLYNLFFGESLEVQKIALESLTKFRDNLIGFLGYLWDSLVGGLKEWWDSFNVTDFFKNPLSFFGEDDEVKEIKPDAKKPPEEVAMKEAKLFKLPEEGEQGYKTVLRDRPMEDEYVSTADADKIYVENMRRKIDLGYEPSRMQQERLARKERMIANRERAKEGTNIVVNQVGNGTVMAPQAAPANANPTSYDPSTRNKDDTVNRRWLNQNWFEA